MGNTRKKNGTMNVCEESNKDPTENNLLFERETRIKSTPFTLAKKPTTFMMIDRV